MSISLEGKTFVIMGVANKRSIAWGIARSLDQSGANLIFTYAGERFEKSVRDLVATLDGNHELILPCDVTNDEAVAECFTAIKEQVGTIHGLARIASLSRRTRNWQEIFRIRQETDSCWHKTSVHTH